MHVRFAPKADKRADVSLCPLSANRVVTRRSKMRRYSITSSARPESGSGTLILGQFAFRS
jgi:hypothetical protein